MIFEATKANGIFGNIALDDISYLPGGTCEYFDSTTTRITTTLEPPPPIFECDFESNFCDWYADPSSNSRWTRRNGVNAKFGSAPLNDVTVKNSLGFYAYVGNVYTGAKSSAILKSPIVDITYDSCLEFYYQMGGQVDSVLNVIIQDNKIRAPVWQRNGNLDDIWSHAFISLTSNLTQNKWIQFEG